MTTDPAPSNLAANSKPHTPNIMTNPRTDELLQLLVNCSIGSISNLQRSIDISLDGISDWIAKPKNRRKIGNLVALLDAQTQLLICQHRVGAVARLAEVASRDAKPEVVRRACADLLKLRLIDPYKEDRRPDKMPPAEPKTREEVHADFLRAQEEQKWMLDMLNGSLPPTPGPAPGSAPAPGLGAVAPRSTNPTPLNGNQTPQKTSRFE